ncbi:3',5'-cyclic adenosine monophosphate phosphodiesterase CpdA [Paenibacillus auburnensis]|uniref:3',5'-cyclic adenosine monophosphate phosphodiesterase CpdA n=1 Tax=Paenibacillus auburnensis TaxID=2905649 RepID=A0ABM9BWE6_9BACL|nr:metallophosphoesterase [Paenibacillus auburnensis]CAH1194883.1 3',5'-cyclic adenosine monophosphate phosphodiesterase CpdA [Paenibacillus auburnensis]
MHSPVRRLLLWILLSLLFLLLSCSRQAEQNPVFRIQSGQNIKLLTTTDTHYLSPGLTDNGPAFSRFLAAGDGKQVTYSDETLNALEYDIGLQRPAAVIISGDLTHNGEKASHQDLAKHLQSIEQRTGTRVYVIPGNHDVQNPWARSFQGERQIPVDSVSPRAFRSIYGAFGYEEAVLSDKDSLSYLAAPSDDLWLLMLDTSQYRSNKKLGHPQLDGQLSASTLKWIDKCSRLAADHGAHMVAVMHHSLLDHSEFIQDGFTINNNKQVIETLVRSGITTVLSGHIHIQDIRKYSAEATDIYDIAESALSVYPHQYGVLNYSPADQTLDYSTSRLNVELWAKAAGNTDSNLLHFDAYSEEAFRKLSADRSYARLAQDSRYANYTSIRLQAMADVVGKLNEIYFAGTADSDLAAVLASEGYRLWQDAPASGLRSYVVGMAQLEQQDNHHLLVKLTGR